MASSSESWRIGRWVGELLDRSIVFSFDRTGYLRHRASFRPDDDEIDLRGRMCLVTGANAGLGFETAHELARRRASVRLLCRNPEHGETAADEIRRRTGNDDVRLEIVDLSSLDSIRALASRLPERAIDVLVNNAGILLGERAESAEGIELTFATNVIGPFALTFELLPRLRAARSARVINVSSGGLYGRKLELEDWEWRRRPFDGVAAYALSKRATVVLTEMWAEHLFESSITVNAMHPGWADTPGVRSSLPRFRAFLRPILRAPAEGADTIVWLAACPRLEGTTGFFWFDRRSQPTHLVSWTRESAEDRDALWALCRDLTGIDEIETTAKPVSLPISPR